MKLQLIKKQTSRALFWLNMAEESKTLIAYREKNILLQEQSRYPYLFYRKSTYENDLQTAKELLNFCIDRFNKVTINKISL